MSAERKPYYEADLAMIHHRGFAFHADDCAPGILRILASVLERRGLIVELGCGSGLLTRYLLDAGHRVIASDASPAMLEIATQVAFDAEDIRQIVLPDQPIPEADAIVSIGHVLNYLPDAASIERALVAIARALRPGGILAIDLCDLGFAAARRDAVSRGWTGEDWAIITKTSVPSPDMYVRDMTTFVRAEDGTWRRGWERHDNVMVDTRDVVALLGAHGVTASVNSSFGEEHLPDGLHTVIGERR